MAEPTEVEDEVIGDEDETLDPLLEEEEVEEGFEDDDPEVEDEDE